MNKKIKIFVYGSLTDQGFVRELLGKRVRTKPAKLRGYKKVTVRGKKYPFAVKRPDAVISGKLLTVDSKALRIIDGWEETPEKLYKRIKSRVETNRGEEEAFVYVTEIGKLKGFGIVSAFNG